MDQVQCPSCNRFYSPNEEHRCPAEGQDSESPISAEEELEKISFHESTSDVPDDSFSKFHQATSKRKLEDVDFEDRSSKIIKKEKESSDTLAENVASTSSSHTPSNTPQCSLSGFASDFPDGTELQIDSKRCVFCGRFFDSNDECHCLEIPDENVNVILNPNLSENVPQMDADFNLMNFPSEYFENFSALIYLSGSHDNLKTIWEAEPSLTSNEISVLTDSDNGFEVYAQKVSSESTSENEEIHLGAVSFDQLQHFSGASDSSSDSTRRGGDNVQAKDTKNSGEYSLTLQTIVSNELDVIPDVDEDGTPIAGPSGIRTQPQRNEEKKRFKCDECGRGLANKQNLKMHQKRHRGEKLFECSTCGREFLVKNDFKNHMRLHSGKRKYTCHLCGKTFGDKAQRSRHISRRHSGSRPFVCAECGNSFKQKYVLKKHLQTHNPKKQLECEVCGMVFPYHQSLTAHFKKKHQRK